MVLPKCHERDFPIPIPSFSLLHAKKWEGLQFSNLGVLCGVKGHILPVLTLCPCDFGLEQTAGWGGVVHGCFNADI